MNPQKDFTGDINVSGTGLLKRGGASRFWWFHGNYYVSGGTLDIKTTVYTIFGCAGTLNWTGGTIKLAAGDVADWTTP